MTIEIRELVIQARVADDRTVPDMAASAPQVQIAEERLVALIVKRVISKLREELEWRS